MSRQEGPAIPPHRTDITLSQTPRGRTPSRPAWWVRSPRRSFRKSGRQPAPRPARWAEAKRPEPGTDGDQSGRRRIALRLPHGLLRRVADGVSDLAGRLAHGVGCRSEVTSDSGSEGGAPFRWRARSTTARQLSRISGDAAKALTTAGPRVEPHREDRLIATAQHLAGADAGRRRPSIGARQEAGFTPQRRPAFHARRADIALHNPTGPTGPAQPQASVHTAPHPHRPHLLTGGYAEGTARRASPLPARFRTRVGGPSCCRGTRAHPARCRRGTDPWPGCSG
ncbi:hypothetical protein SUDANB96_06646 [Streptomyces sp. enrichment culture]